MLLQTTMKHGGTRDARLLPELEGLLVVAVERLERGLEPRRQLERIELLGLAAALLRHVLADVLPEVAEHRHLVAGDVVGDRHARQLDDAALDRVHQREVAHRPGEQRALGVAGAAQEERRRRQVDDARRRRACASRPRGRRSRGGRPRCSSRLPCCSSPFRSSSSSSRLLAVAVVRLVVEHQDVLHAHQLGHDALEHLAFGLQRVAARRPAALEQRAAALRQLHPLAQLEGVVVGDDDLAPSAHRRACRRARARGSRSSCRGRSAGARAAGP